MSSVFLLNVGGCVFPTYRSTLLNSNSFLSGLVGNLPDEEYEAFVDRDPTHFRHVLNWIRGVRVVNSMTDIATLHELRAEADFFALSDLAEAVESRIRFSFPR